MTYLHSDVSLCPGCIRRLVEDAIADAAAHDVSVMFDEGTQSYRLTILFDPKVAEAVARNDFQYSGCILCNNSKIVSGTRERFKRIHGDSVQA